MKYYVSRQKYWPDGDRVVEVASGGLDYSNPDMLGVDKKYNTIGCNQEYTDPREAVKVAIAIRDLWNRSTPFREPARVETGYTAGMTMPFCSYPTDESLVEWATARWEKLISCEYCGEKITGEEWHHVYDHDVLFCSDYCVEEYHRENWTEAEAD